MAGAACHIIFNLFPYINVLMQDQIFPVIFYVLYVLNCENVIRLIRAREY